MKAVTIKDLEEKIINSILQIDSLTQERAQLQTTRDDLQSNLSELKQRLENASNEIETANANNENLKQTIGNLISKLEESNKKALERLEKIENLETEKTGLEENLSESNQVNFNLNKQIEQHNVLIKTLQVIGNELLHVLISFCSGCDS